MSTRENAPGVGPRAPRTTSIAANDALISEGYPHDTTRP